MEFQFTLPCGERRKILEDQKCSFTISIHAPVWGATLSGECERKKVCYFNSRSRVGSDMDSMFIATVG